MSVCLSVCVAAATSAKKECVRLKAEWAALDTEVERLRKEVFVHPNRSVPSPLKPIEHYASSSSGGAGGNSNSYVFSQLQQLQQSPPQQSPQAQQQQLSHDVNQHVYGPGQDFSENNPALLKLVSNEKYKELNIRLRRLLTEERRALQTVSYIYIY
jgi:hypothetical protein